ncbi:MAG: oligosaccharide flippase family protein, partial [Bacteroidota bacterium]|nr:oligosaccharide flippase family protein [Bacteroidota bacterium]
MQNESHLKKLFSQTVIYGLGIFLNKSVNFILLPVYTKYFSPEEIGMFTLVQSLSLFLGVIYTFGVETSFMKYFIDAKDTSSKSGIYSSSLLLLSITSFIMSILVFIHAADIAALFRFTAQEKSIYLIKILSVLLMIDTIYRFPLLLFRAELNSKKYAWINLLTFIVNIVCNIIFIVVLKQGVEAIFYSYIISVTVTFAAGLILTKKYLTSGVSLDTIKRLLRYGNKFIYIGIFIILIDMSDRFFLKYFYDESVVGIYWANYRLATLMSLVIAAFKFSWTPYFLNLSSNPENKKIISSIFTYFVFAGLVMFLFFSVFMDQITGTTIFGFEILDENYRSGLHIVPIVLLAYLLSGIYSILNAAPFFTDNTRAILIITFAGLVINIIFNFVLIPELSITGAALSTMITYFSMFLIIYFYSQKIYKIEYDWNKIAGLSFLTAAAF